MALTGPQQTFVRRVLQKVDAVDPAGSGISGNYDEIYASAEEAARQFLLEAPKSVIQEHALDDTTAVNAEITPHDYNLQVPIPKDFLRLHTLWLVDWTAPVYEESVESAEDDTYRDELRRRTGTVDAPKVFQVYSSPST